MDQQHDPNLTPPPVDEGRRRLAKAGLAAPAVLGMLASRPVLANQFHHCTPSGHISGFASPNPNAAACNTLGRSPSYYAAGPSTWPDGNVNGSFFINNSGGVRLFKNSPQKLGSFHGALVRFADAYQRRNTTNGNINDATVWDVLKGFPVNASGNPINNQILEARSGFNTDLTLGAEAVAAVMNALLYAPQFPITPQQAVEMFNKVVVSGGLYQVTSTNDWDAAEIKFYWQSLHA